MKKLFVLFALTLVVVGGVFAQEEAAEAVGAEASSVVIYDFAGGEFIETEDMDVFTLTLNDAASQLDYLDVQPSFGLRSFETSLFNLGLEAALETLEGVEALLVIDGQQVVVNVTGFAIEDETTVSFTVELLEVIPTIDSKDAEELYFEFEGAEFYMYLDGEASDTINTSLSDLGLRGNQR